MRQGSQFLLISVLLVALSAPCLAQTPAAALKLDSKAPFNFVAYGDVRFMNPSETKASDPVRRKLLVQKIADEKPLFLLITGDVVEHGSNAAQWNVFDEETAPLRTSGVKIYPALGNHDLWGGAEALEHYFQRFPDLQHSRYYSLRVDNLMVFTLDSSEDERGGDEMQWLDRQIDALPQDVQFVVVQLHHPPLTRSHDRMLGGGHSPREPEEEMASFLESRASKSKAKFVVVTGHVHNYERYERNGVMYVVSGGGGATPYKIHRQPNDYYRDDGPTYHYCRFEVRRGKLAMHMIKLDWDGKNTNWQERDSFELASK